MSNYTNEDIKNALQDVKNGLSQRKAASRNGVPRQTLRDRIAGALPHSEAHKHHQKLSEAQEQYLRDWILVQGAIGFPPTHIQVREFAQRIARKNGYDEPIGRHWIKNFLARHKEIKTHRSRKIDTARFNGATTDRIKAFFQLLQLPAIKDIPKENRYNMDECGVMEGQGHNGLVLGNAEKSVVLQKNPGSRIWTTIVECISADGRALTPLVIFKGRTVQQQWFPENLDFLSSWDFTSSIKGWTNDKIALTWLKTIFIPQTMPQKKGEKRLLIIDGHGSHATDDFMFECFYNGIYVLWLPPHSSHVTQPLDVAVFGPVKNAYRRALSRLDSDDDSSLRSKISFLKCYNYARKDAITRKNIIAGFKTSGQWPVSVKNVLRNSMVTADQDDEERPKKRPKIASQPSKMLYETPQSSKELRNVLNNVFREEKISRPIRHLFNKLGQELDCKNAREAGHEQQLTLLQHDIEEAKPKKRKKITFDPNRRFGKVSDVVKAREDLCKILDPSGTSKKVKTKNDEPREYVWHLETMEMRRLGLHSLQLDDYN